LRTLEVPTLLPETGPKSERNSLVVITDDPEILPELRKYLGGSFHISFATTEGEIKSALEKTELHAILFNLDAIGNAPRDGLEVIEEIRKIRDDVVLAAFTRSDQRTIPLKASQAGTDEFFLFPMNYHELEIVLSRAIEKRALELEGRRLLQQVENKTVFYGFAENNCNSFGHRQNSTSGPLPFFRGSFPDHIELPEFFSAETEEG